MLPYLISKKLGEQALWKVADEYPELNITTSKRPSTNSRVNSIERLSPPLQLAQLLLLVHSPKILSSPRETLQDSALLLWSTISLPDQRSL